MPRVKIVKEPCGCYEREVCFVLCRFHWNQNMIAHRLHDCLMWDRSGKLNPDDPADAAVLNFYRDLAYWAAKGATEAGGLVK